ncbi:MAG TPA: O-antigen ligase family protein [Gaiellaceae bacterium]|nr:O-antigen ligase family protein [Gaiellaceae bacterium]
MRAVRELSLAAPLLLVGLALFFGGGPADGSISWLGGLALLSILVLLAVRGLPGGALSVVPLAVLAAWCAVSIAWSWLPDRSWDYANRTTVYALAALLGLWAAARTRALAAGLALLLGAVIVWSLLGKVLPSLYDYGGPDVTRLRGPIGLWNQLALAADFGLLLALVFRKRFGVLLAYAALVALLLTYSRGGVITAVVVLAAWFLLSDDRLEGAACLIAAAIPAAVVVGIAFALPGITKNGQSTHVRWRDGLVFGIVLVAGAAVALALENRALLRNVRVVRWIGAAAVCAAIAAGIVVLVRGVGSGTVGNGGGRFASTSSNFRFTWWKEAWHGFTHHVLAGTGAGSFNLLNLLYRKSYLDFTIEPHDLPLQFLAELGVVGLVLLVVAMAVLLRRGIGRRGHELALALLLPAFLIHSLVDIDWDFAAVAIPAFVAAGAVAGRPGERRLSANVLLPATGVAILLAGAFFSPWLARRWANDALFTASSSHAITLANRAHSLDPLLLDPYWAKASALDASGKTQQAFDEYVAAVKRQPHNPDAWYFAGKYAWEQHCPYLAYDYLLPYTELNQNALGDGGDIYNAALKRVNHRQYRC